MAEQSNSSRQKAGRKGTGRRAKYTDVTDQLGFVSSFLWVLSGTRVIYFCSLISFTKCSNKFQLILFYWWGLAVVKWFIVLKIFRFLKQPSLMSDIKFINATATEQRLFDLVFSFFPYSVLSLWERDYVGSFTVSTSKSNHVISVRIWL